MTSLCTDKACPHAIAPHWHPSPSETVRQSRADAINHVAHYNAGKIECIDAMEAAIVGQTAFEGAMSSTALKYIWRWKHKNGVEDVKKAVWYLNRLIAHLEKSKP